MINRFNGCGATLEKQLLYYIGGKKLQKISKGMEMTLSKKELDKQKYLEMKEGNAYLNRIIKTGIYGRRLSWALPKIISADYKGTKINSKAPCPDEDEWVNKTADGDMIQTSKIIIKGGGDWEFYAFMVKASNFSTRKDFDEVVLEGTHCSSGAITPQVVSRIPLVEAFKTVGVQISLNVDYLVNTATEEQKDTLETKKWQYGKENAEKMILYSFLVSLFGKSPSNETDYNYPKRLCFNDFHFYMADGNASYGTARHGDHYVFLEFVTS